MYTTDGRTLRQLFREMPPKSHNMDQTKSEVLAYIAQQLNSDMIVAIRAFNSMRNPTSKVLVFDAIERVWIGCDWIPDNKEAREEYLIKEVRSWDRKVADLKAEIASVEKENHDLKKKLKKLDDAFDSFENKAKKWFEALEHHAGIDCENYTFKSEGKPPADDPFRAVREAFENS